MDARYVRRKVSVMVLHAADGRMHPVELLWEDGRSFKVEQVGEPAMVRCRRTGGYAVLYPVSVNGCRRELCRGDGGWFVEVEGGRCAPADPRKGDVPE